MPNHIIGRLYRKGKVEGRLRITQREGANYKWVSCLALMDDDGHWLVSSHWQTNYHWKAHNELVNMGWSRVDE